MMENRLTAMDGFFILSDLPDKFLPEEGVSG